jgi:hypothetical protein
MLTLLALALVQAELPPEAAWGRVETTYQHWAACTLAAAREHATEPADAETIGAQAAAQCDAAADGWRAAFSAWLLADHRDVAIADGMFVAARCHMVRRGAAAAIAYRPVVASRARGARAPGDESCRATGPVVAGEAH